MNSQDEHETRQDDAQDAPEREVNPAEDPGPRGNDEADPERVAQEQEDLDRTLPG